MKDKQKTKNIRDYQKERIQTSKMMTRDRKAVRGKKSTIEKRERERVE